MKLGGLYIYYYHVCKRKLWFYAKKITMEHESDLVSIGKYIELFYKEEKKMTKKLIIDDISPDEIKKLKDTIIVFELKKSEKFKNASIWQLKYYLYYLKKYKGITAKGKLIIPTIKKEEIVELTKEDYIKIEDTLKEIKKIIKSDIPPKIEFKKPYCKNCSYKLICWKDEI